MTRRTTLTAAVSVLVGGTLADCSSAQGTAVASGPVTHQLTIGSDSMDPTIVKAQKITVDAVNPGTYQPHRQDIVVMVEYLSLGRTNLFVRRVIGIPGDTVSCDGDGHPLMLNGAALSEPYLHKGDSPSVVPFDVKIPAGCLWLLGDHRAIALDCRYHLSDPNHGAIPIADVVGIYYPKA